jgi:protein SCO1/2
MMDHSTFLFLLDREGRYVDHFGRTADEAQVARRVVTALAAAPSRARSTSMAGK